MTGGLLAALGEAYDDTPPTAEDFAAYVYAVFGGQSYTAVSGTSLKRPAHAFPYRKTARPSLRRRSSAAS